MVYDPTTEAREILAEQRRDDPQVASYYTALIERRKNAHNATREWDRILAEGLPVPGFRGARIPVTGARGERPLALVKAIFELQEEERRRAAVAAVERINEQYREDDT